MATVIASVLGAQPQQLEGVETVKDVKSRLQLSNYTANVNGTAARDDTRLSNDDFVALAPAVKGGNANC